MKRWLYAYRPIKGEPAALERRLLQNLPALLAQATDSAADAPAGDGSVLIRLPANVGAIAATKSARVHIGVATRADLRLVVPISWRADPAPQAFPAFQGTIELEPLSSDRAQLMLVGAYTVPLGPVGALADSTVLRGAAERTADWLVQRLAAALTQPVPAAPGRQIGPRPLLVDDVMTADPVTFDEDLPLRTAAMLLFHFGVSGAPVVDAHGGLVGVLSEADLLEKEAVPRLGLTRAARESERRKAARTVGEACTRPARTTAPDTSLQAAAGEMRDRNVARLVVIDGARIAGIITRHDVLRALIQADEDIARAVTDAVTALGEPQVGVSVEWGVVTLTGEVSRLSRLGPVTAAVEALDGVIAVDAEDLTFRHDDVTPLTRPVV